MSSEARRGPERVSAADTVPKPVELDNREQLDVDDADEITEIIPGDKNPYAVSSKNREATDPSMGTRATFALAESGIADNIATSGVEIKSADAKMETQLIQEAVGLIRAKLELGRDPNELLIQTMEELDGVEDEIEDLSEGNQTTMLKDAQMRKAKLSAQVYWLRAHMDREK